MEQGCVLDEDAPYSSWPAAVQRVWSITHARRITRELTFCHVVGIVLCLACIPLDSVTGVPVVGATLRLGVVVPSYLIGIWLIRSEHSLLRLVGAVAPVAGFAGVVSFIGTQTIVEFSDRYLMAATMMVAMAVLLLPLRIGASCWLSVSGFVAIALPFGLGAAVDVDIADLLLYSLVCCTFPLLFKRRSDRLRDQNFILSVKSRQAQSQLLKINKELENLSQMDPLTGLLNRRGFEKRFSATFEAVLASGEPLAVVLLDVDHFKHFNDTYGHQLGDECLAKIGALLNSEIERHKGIAARYGGEEFIATLTGSESANAVSIAERVRKMIADLEILDTCGNRIRITASFGARIARAAKLRQQDFVRDADGALYAAKANGRNRVVLYEGRDKSPLESVGAGGAGSRRYGARVPPQQSEFASSGQEQRS
ncbi:GGDEF domain-containing protein [Aurantiacibacter suaedae]|uniref:GGDEF domain-containing protein n=1 Tax=Aurantiacibacter suaedae TaxID=2545755 RepID=UPI0013867AD0|nr:GGDEF domain-containing protein [Aurantiacibacter suaedae]